MCLATPVLILNIQGNEGLIEIGGLRRTISLALTPGVKQGDYVLVHAGYAIGTLNQKEAEETLRLLEEMEDLSGEGDNGPLPHP
jgi:hydrogenase expression/formation protein HypC